MTTYKALPRLTSAGNWTSEESKARKTGRVYAIRDPKLGGLRSGKGKPGSRRFACVLVHPRFWTTAATALKNCDAGCQVVKVNPDYSTTVA